MADFDIDSIELVLDEQVIPLHATLPEEFHYRLEGRIVDYTNPENIDHPLAEGTEAGRFRISIADFERAMEAGHAPVDVLDRNADSRAFASIVLDRHGRPYSERLEPVLRYFTNGSNLLMLDRLEVLPNYRGGGLGLLVMRALIQRYALNVAVVGLQVIPLQFCPRPDAGDELGWWTRMGLDAAPRDQQAAVRKLKRYDSRLGFRAIRGTVFMFMPGDYVLPSPQSLLRKRASRAAKPSSSALQ